MELKKKKGERVLQLKLTALKKFCCSLMGTLAVEKRGKMKNGNSLFRKYQNERHCVSFPSK